MTQSPEHETDPAGDATGQSADVEQLRRRVQELEGELAARPGGPGEGARSRRDRQWWRSVVVVLLIVVATVLAPLSVVATWAHDQVGDTDQFVSTVAPLASDPAVQDAVATRITEEILTNIDVQRITGKALSAVSQQDFVPPRAASVLPSLAVPLSSAIERFVRERVDQVVQSDTFQEAWVTAMRQAHAQMVAVLSGDTSGAVDVTNGAVTINIASFVASVKKVLIDEGFTFANRIPEVNASFTIFKADNIGTAQTWYSWLDTAARVLPVLGLLLLVAAVLVARSRRTALLAAGLSIAGSMVLLGLALNLLRPVYLDAIPSDVLPTDAAAAVYDTLVQYMRTSLRAVGIVFLAIALAAFWFAPSGAGAAVRTGTAHQLSRLRARATGAGMDTGPVGQFLGTYRTFTRVVVVAVGAILYVGIDHPTGGNAIAIITAIVLVLVVLEFLAAPQQDTEAREA